jgi:hypothetical protein
MTRIVKIPFVEIKKSLNLKDNFEFCHKISDNKVIGRKSFGTILKMVKDLATYESMQEDPWMNKCSEILNEYMTDVRDQINYGIYMFVTAKVTTHLSFHGK